MSERQQSCRVRSESESSEVLARRLHEIFTRETPSVPVSRRPSESESSASAPTPMQLGDNASVRFSPLFAPAHFLIGLLLVALCLAYTALLVFVSFLYRVTMLLFHIQECHSRSSAVLKVKLSITRTHVHRGVTIDPPDGNDEAGLHHETRKPVA